MNLKKITGRCGLVAALVLGSYYALDAKIALFVKKTIMTNLVLFSSNVPDLLFIIVCVITVLAWTAYFLLARKGVFNSHTQFSQLVAVAVPLTFVLKACLKFAIGRIDTRFWLRYPGSKEFQWFHGVGNHTGFPSGHMAVFTAFLAAAAGCYPRSRRFCYGVLSVLALALIATNYHFLSDVIAGAYLGYIVQYFTRFGLQAPGTSTKAMPASTNDSATHG